MKKNILTIIFLIMLLINSDIYASNENIIENQTNELDIDNFISDTENILGEINLDEIFNHALEGKSSKNIIIKSIGILLGKELGQALKMIISILIIIIIHGLLRNISINLGNEQTGKIAYLVQIIMLITVLMKIYAEIIEIVKETLDTMFSFIYSLIPLVMSIMISTGNITTAGSIQSLILVSTNAITSFINQILIPIIIIATVIGIVSNISDEIKMHKLSKYMKSSIIWILGACLTIFTCILSMESNLGQGVDQLTSKTTKTAVTTFVPVVGKILGDTVESVLGCTNIIKNAIGAVGMIAILIIGILPIIRIGITTIFIYLASGLAEVVADKKIVYVLEEIGDSCKVLLAALSTVLIMLIIGITITMKIGLAI